MIKRVNFFPFKNRYLNVASARAGNVIGGGDFKKDRRDDFLDSLSEGKDYGSKVDALVDSMSVTDDKVSITHRRKDLDLL